MNEVAPEPPIKVVAVLDQGGDEAVVEAEPVLDREMISKLRVAVL